MDFPGGPVVKNPPANAGDDMGSTSALGSFHMLGATIKNPPANAGDDMDSTSALGSFHMLGASIEPVRLEPVLCNKRSHCKEKPAPHNKE